MTESSNCFQKCNRNRFCRVVSLNFWMDYYILICTHHSEGADEISGKLCWLVAAICQEGDGLILCEQHSLSCYLQIGIVEKWYQLWFSLQFDFSYRGLFSWLYWKVRSFSDIVPTMGCGRQLYIDDGVLCNRSSLSHAEGGSLIIMSKDNANQTLWTAMTLLSMLWLYYFLLLILLVATRVLESGLLL